MLKVGFPMRNRASAICVAVLFLLCGCAGAPDGPATYYVDSSGGDDRNSGLSPENAWKSLDKVNGAVFGPGESILFKAGSSFAGQLRPQGSGAAEAPITVGLYGEGDKPLIAAGGEFNEALLLENQEYWEISSLKLTNKGPAEAEFRYGVRVRSWDFGVMHHIHLKDLDVYDVNGSLVKKDPGEGHGITWETGGDEKLSRFDDLLIEGCHLVRTDRNGISGYSAYPHGHGEKWFPSTNVVIRRNVIEDTGGDAIKVWGCDGALVEHNVVRGARMRADDYAAGIWPWSSDNTVIQFNEVSGLKGTKDGQAFDTDGYCHNTLFQYNYSHDNDGGFMLICVRDNPGTVIRYNISQNDKARLFHIAGPLEDIEIYNNVFYTNKEIELDLFLWGGRADSWPKDVRIFNNIFYIEGVGRNSYGLERKKPDDGTFVKKPGFGGAKQVVFENNILYGNFEGIPQAWRAMVKDPSLKAPGTGGDSLETTSGYELKDGSPAIGAGKLAEKNGGRDFWGNAVSAESNPSIGVHEP